MMFIDYQGLAKTKRALVGLGDSFVAGQGAIDDELYETYQWIHHGPGIPLDVQVDQKTKLEIVKKYPTLRLTDHGGINPIEMWRKNCFLNVLAEKYLEGRYSVINFGIPGGANRGRVKELYLNPRIDWNSLEEIIVIYMPTSIERFDFVDDSNPFAPWKTIWPKSPDGSEKTSRGKLWDAYGMAVFSEKSAMIEQLAIVQELLTWTKLHKAKLIITPGFDNRYQKAMMRKILSMKVERNDDWEIVNETHDDPDFRANDFLNLFPWQYLLKPEGHATMAHLCMSKEPSLLNNEDFYQQFQNNRSPLGWMTPCSHPGQKGHDLYARLVWEFLNS